MVLPSAFWACGNRRAAIGVRQSACGNRPAAIGLRQSACGNRLTLAAVRITVLFNPIAGGGHAAGAARALQAKLEGAGHHRIDLVESRPGAETSWLDPLLAGSDLLVVVGGDGAVRLAASAAMRTGTAIYQLPLGTENLFAREWGMNRSAATLVRAIAVDEVVEIDVGRADGECFVLMASVGYDAEVVHELAAKRRGGISHLSYLAPMLRSLRGFASPRLRVVADGRRIDDDGPGFVIVGNSRQYAMRVNPACDASMEDGRLDVVYFPTANIAELLTWMVTCTLGRHRRNPRLVYATAERITIESDLPFRHQLDGDPPWNARQGSNRLEIEVVPRALRVLVAARSARTGRSKPEQSCERR